MATPMIKLQSADGKVFEIPQNVACCSTTLKTMLEDLGPCQSDDEPIPLPTVRGTTLSKIIEWAQYHVDDPGMSDDTNTDLVNVTPWDSDFLKVDQGTLFEIVMAANYLDIRSLLNITCQTVANMIKGKKAEDIRKTFNIKNDLTPEEIAAVEEEMEFTEP